MVNFTTLNHRCVTMVSSSENKGIKRYKPIYEWVQCGKCRKRRMLDTSSSSGCLPPEWFCYMPPFNGKCETAEEHMPPFSGKCVTAEEHMPPFSGKCVTAEEHTTCGETTIGAKRSHPTARLAQTKVEMISTSTKKSDCEQDQLDAVGKTPSKPILIPSPIKEGIVHDTSSRSSLACKLTSEDDSEEDTSKLEFQNPPFELRWARKGRKGNYIKQL